MAKPTKYATLICTIVSILALIGIVIGILISKPLIIVILLHPAAAYEVYRTEGPSTIWASWLLLIILIMEIIFIAANISFAIVYALNPEIFKNLIGLAVDKGIENI